MGPRIREAYSIWLTSRVFVDDIRYEPSATRLRISRGQNSLPIDHEKRLINAAAPGFIGPRQDGMDSEHTASMRSSRSTSVLIGGC